MAKKKKKSVLTHSLVPFHLSKRILCCSVVLDSLVAELGGSAERRDSFWLEACTCWKGQCLLWNRIQQRGEKKEQGERWRWSEQEHGLEISGEFGKREKRCVLGGMGGDTYQDTGGAGL